MKHYGYYLEGIFLNKFYKKDMHAVCDGKSKAFVLMCGIEGITSPDGRVFGKMAHAERRDNGVAVNIYGEQDIRIFESGVEYFK